MGSVSSIFREQEAGCPHHFLFLPSCGCICVRVWISRFVVLRNFFWVRYKLTRNIYATFFSASQQQARKVRLLKFQLTLRLIFLFSIKFIFPKSHIRIIPTHTSIYFLAILSISPSSGLMTTRDISPSGKIPSVLVRFIVTKARASKPRSGWAFWIVRIT